MNAEIFKEIDALQKEINIRRPFDERVLKQIREYYRIGLTYTSNALEGNSLTETETKIVLEEGITIGGKRLIDHLEVIGHGDALNYLYECIKNKNFSEDDIKKLHQLFYYRIDEKYAGIYRDIKIFISGCKYPFAQPEDLPKLMKELIVRLGGLKDKMHPVEFAALVHKEFVFVHPFIDGNGRVARLLMNLSLLQAGYNIAIIPPIMRSKYIETLEKAHVDDKDFIMFIAQMVKETQKDYLRLFV